MKTNNELLIPKQSDEDVTTVLEVVDALKGPMSAGDVKVQELVRVQGPAPMLAALRLIFPGCGGHHAGKRRGRPRKDHQAPPKAARGVGRGHNSPVRSWMNLLTHERISSVALKRQLQDRTIAPGTKLHHPGKGKMMVSVGPTVNGPYVLEALT